MKTCETCACFYRPTRKDVWPQCRRRAPVAPAEILPQSSPNHWPEVSSDCAGCGEHQEILYISEEKAKLGKQEPSPEKAFNGTAELKKVVEMFDEVAFELTCRDGKAEIWDSRIVAWEAAYPNVAVRAELLQAEEWSVANTNKRKTVGGAHRFLNSWLGRAQKDEKKELNGSRDLCEDPHCTNWSKGETLGGRWYCDTHMPNCDHGHDPAGKAPNQRCYRCGIPIPAEV